MTSNTPLLAAGNFIKQVEKLRDHKELKGIEKGLHSEIQAQYCFFIVFCLGLAVPPVFTFQALHVTKAEIKKYI